MKLEWYRRQMRRSLFSAPFFWQVNRGLSLLVALGYGMVLLGLGWRGSWLRLAFALVIPAAVFLLTGWLRKKLDRPRPFALLGEPPLHPHESGQGCPSRHTASAVILCWTALLLPGWMGWTLWGVLLVLACLIGAIRIFTGMHFLRDVLLGAGLSAFIGALAYLPLLLFALF